MFLPRFSTRTMLIILAAAALLFTIVSQGLIGLSQRWGPNPEDGIGRLADMLRLGQVGVWRQAAAAVSVALVALALLMTINAMFFFIGWLLGSAAGKSSGPAQGEPPPAATENAKVAQGEEP